MTTLNTIRMVVYPARDLPAATASWKAALGTDPLWQSPDYVAFGAGEQEIGLSRLPWFDEPIVFWRVADIEAAWRELTAGGATALGEVEGGSMAALPEAAVVNGDTDTGIVTVPGRKLAVLRTGDGGLIGIAEDVPTAW